MHAEIFAIDGTLLQSAAIDEFLYVQAIRSVLGPVRFRPTWADYDCVTDTGILSQLLHDNSLPKLPGQISAIEQGVLAPAK